VVGGGGGGDTGGRGVGGYGMSAEVRLGWANGLSRFFVLGEFVGSCGVYEGGGRRCQGWVRILGIEVNVGLWEALETEGVGGGGVEGKAFMVGKGAGRHSRAGRGGRSLGVVGGVVGVRGFEWAVVQWGGGGGRVLWCGVGGGFGGGRWGDGGVRERGCFLVGCRWVIGEGAL
jgi:hypothetical protein